MQVYAVLLVAVRLRAAVAASKWPRALASCTYAAVALSLAFFVIDAVNLRSAVLGHGLDVALAGSSFAVVSLWVLVEITASRLQQASSPTVVYLGTSGANGHDGSTSTKAFGNGGPALVELTDVRPAPLRRGISLLSDYVFVYSYSFLRKHYRRPLEESDIPALEQEETTSAGLAAFRASGETVDRMLGSERGIRLKLFYHCASAQLVHR